MVEDDSKYDLNYKKAILFGEVSQKAKQLTEKREIELQKAHIFQNLALQVQHILRTANVEHKKKLSDNEEEKEVSSDSSDADLSFNEPPPKQIMLDRRRSMRSRGITDKR